jgi:hypothetical protein
VLLNTRRAFSRFSSASEWLQGHVVWFSSPDDWKNLFASVPFGHSAVLDKESKGSYNSSWQVTYRYLSRGLSVHVNIVKKYVSLLQRIPTYGSWPLIQYAHV